MVAALHPGASSRQPPHWHAPFLAMLPAIKRQARHRLAGCSAAEQEEAMQAVIAYAAVTYARLVQLQKTELAYPSPLARFGLKQYWAGRHVGGSINSQDVSSDGRFRRQGLESFEDWKEVLSDSRRATPAELAALRVDFADWLETLSPRNRKLAQTLARSELTSSVASMFRLTAGRVSQLRRELYESWQLFVGEPVLGGCG